MQRLLIIIGLAMAGLLAIWAWPENDEATRHPQAVSEPDKEEEVVARDTVLESTDVPETAEAIVPDSTSDDDATARSPFTVLPPAGSADSISPDDDGPTSSVAENSDDIAPAVSDSAEGVDSRSEILPAIVVPSSYPASDAAKYFVPADQRRPGNLGGPPPPPGSDPAFSSNNGGLTPPPAPPGQ